MGGKFGDQGFRLHIKIYRSNFMFSTFHSILLSFSITFLFFAFQGHSVRSARHQLL
jgi:hypothetical protein